MKPLIWIIAEAKKLKKQFPKRYSKWTDYVKQASAIYSSKHASKSPVAKKKVSGTKTHKDTKSHNVNIKVVSGVGALPVGFKGVIWGVPFKIVNQFDIYNNVKLIVEDTNSGSVITIYDGVKDFKINKDQFVNYIVSYSKMTLDKKDLEKRLTKFSKELQSEVKSYNAGNKKTVKNKTLVISKTTKKKPVVKKVHSKGETVKEIKDILKSDKKRLKGGYTVVPGRVMSGINTSAISELKHINEMIQKWNTVLNTLQYDKKSTKDRLVKTLLNNDIQRVKNVISNLKQNLSNIKKQIK